MGTDVKVKDILEAINSSAPFTLAESWDNVGLLVGNPEQEVSAVLVALDPTTTVLQEALALGANTIITHHPVIFKPLAAINTAESGGRLLARALAEDVAIIGCHTNFDSASEGVSDVLATLLGLGDLTPMLAPDIQREDHLVGLGRIGRYDPPLTSQEFIRRVHGGLDLSTVQVAGRLPETISTVAVCGGSGSDFAPLARSLGAEVYLSAEIKHATAVWAVENDFCVIDGTHYATEKPAVGLLVKQLRDHAKEKDWQITIQQAKTEQHPFTVMEKI